MKMRFRLAAWICILAMALSVLSVPVYASAAEASGEDKVAEQSADQSSDQKESEAAAEESTTTAAEETTTTAAEETTTAAVVKKGNCDAYIGLGKNWMVLATAKKYTKVYKKKKTSSKVLGHFSKNNCIEVATKKMKKGTKYTWLPVYLKNHKIGYIQKKKVSLGKLNIKNFGLNTKGKANAKNRTRVKICKYGLPYIGVRFRLGGTSLTQGIDCSNFVKKAMHNAGVSCHGLAVDLSTQGKKISRNQLKPGDTLYYYNNPHDLRIGHSAIYVGGYNMAPGKGYIINASGHQGSIYPSGGLRFSRIDYRKPTAVRFRNFVGN